MIGKTVSLGRGNEDNEQINQILKADNQIFSFQGYYEVAGLQWRHDEDSQLTSFAIHI